MAKSLHKVGGIGGAGSFEVYDNAGNAEIRVDGIKVLDAQAAAIVSLTDNSGGTGSDTLADIEATYTEATVANSVASLADKIEEILVVLRAHGLIAT